MRTNKIFSLIAVILFLIGIISLASFASEQDTKKITISGGTIGGTSNLAANGMAVIARTYCNMTPTVIVTPTMAQVSILEGRQAQIATTPAYLTYQAYNGQGDWEGKPFNEIRSLTDRVNSQMQIAVFKDSPYYNLSDLEGKRIVVGKKGFTAAQLGEAMFGALGLRYDVEVTPLYLGHADALAALMAGKADAYMLTGAYPHSSLMELSELKPEGIRLINVTEEERKTVLEKCPFFVTRTIDPVYKGMDKSIVTLEYINVYGCVDLTEEDAYLLAKNFWEHQEDATLQWGALGDLELENTSSLIGAAPWHIGAYKYYKEVGLEIPESMIPPEAK